MSRNRAKRLSGAMLLILPAWLRGVWALFYAAEQAAVTQSQRTGEATLGNDYDEYGRLLFPQPGYNTC